jgi:hypothetical protein
MMHRQFFLILFISTTIVLVIAGLFWKKSDIKEIKELNYTKNSEVLIRNYYDNSRAAIDRIKRMFGDKKMHIIDEIQTDDSTLELIGQSRRSWMLSDYLHKITIVRTSPLGINDSFASGALITVYAGNIRGGSMTFFSIAAVCLVTIIAVFIKRENLPHIFP